MRVSAVAREAHTCAATKTPQRFRMFRQPRASLLLLLQAWSSQPPAWASWRGWRRAGWARRRHCCRLLQPCASPRARTSSCLLQRSQRPHAVRLLEARRAAPRADGPAGEARRASVRRGEEVDAAWRDEVRTCALNSGEVVWLRAVQGRRASRRRRRVWVRRGMRRAQVALGACRARSSLLLLHRAGSTGRRPASLDRRRAARRTRAR